MRQLARQTGCSSNCGRCAVTAAEILGQATGQSEPLIDVVQQSTEATRA